MASFDNSYYSILERYNLIREESLQDQINRLRATLDSLKAKNGDSPELQNSYKELDSVAQSAGIAQTPQSSAAQRATPSATSSQPAAQPAGEINQQQKDLFQKLHGTSYNPNSSMDKAKMGQLQSAGAEVGYEDVNKLTNAAYAKQYGDTDKGRAYAKQAGTTQPAQSAPAQSPFKNQSAANPMNPTSVPSINTTPSWNAYSKQTEPRPNFTGSNTPPGAPVASPLQNQSSANPLNTGKPGFPSGKPSWNSYSKQKEARPNFTQKTS